MFTLSTRNEHLSVESFNNFCVIQNLLIDI